MEARDSLAEAPQSARPRVELRVVDLAAVVVGPGVWLPGPDAAATLRAVERLRAVGHVLGAGSAGSTLLDPFLVDGRLRLVYGGDWLAALRRLGARRAQVLVADGLPDDASFRLLLAHLLRPIPATATPMEIHRAEQPIRALITEAARARQRRAGYRTAAARWGAAGRAAIASADFPEAAGATARLAGDSAARAATPAATSSETSEVTAAVTEVLERALDTVASRGDTRTKHRLLGLTSSVDEYEAIEKILAAAADPASPPGVRAVAAAQLAALDTAQPPAISTALRRVHEARHDAHARALHASCQPAPPAVAEPGGELVEAVVAALQTCVERLDGLLSPPSVAAASIARTDAGVRRLRAAAEAAHEIPQLIASVAKVL